MKVNRRTRNVVIGVMAGVFVLLLWAGWMVERSKPDLQIWHTAMLGAEFGVRDTRGGFGWDDYLELEDRLFAEVGEEVFSDDPEVANPTWNRFAAGGRNNPTTFPHDWNRSYELGTEARRGGALLIHGLTDGPYTLRKVGEILNANGLHVVGLRLPGHGTAPSALRHACVDDWRAAVRIAYDHLRDEIGETGQLVIVGYSNGAALALDLALDALSDDQLRPPDRIVLFSPAVGITRAAVLARSHRLLTVLPWFNKLEWSSINPEFDPFKYNSFPKNAGFETHVLTTSVRERLRRLETAGRSADFPPVLTFMSLADATVLVEAVVDGLYDRLSDPFNEFVIFDINRSAAMRGFFRADPVDRLSSLTSRTTTPYRLTVITNADEATNAVVIRTRGAGESEFESLDSGMEWPPRFYSLSHVAVQFPPDDPIYGWLPPTDEAFGLQFGAIGLRGERGLLTVSEALLSRLRANPFFPYVEQRMVELTAAPD
jgi:alpha-beta hydrolase superfamily lysophospholipase